ncbi:MAG: hypothetical protein LBC41_06905 [Clostridiales bacterium]|nr:hypothetical protein [Clostridiales bacterium]
MRNRRRNRWLVWLCVVIVVAGAVVVGINVLSKNPLMLETLLEALPSVMDPVTDPATDLAIDPVIEKVSLPDGLLPQYFALAGNRKYEEMYEMLTDQDKATISRDDFVAKNRSVYDGIEARNITVAIDEVTVVNINGRTVVKYSVRMDTLAGEISYSNQATFDEVKSELSDEDESEDKDKEYRMQWTTRTIFPDLGPSDRVRVQTLEAIRGNIYDRNHELLAGPGMASAVGFVPGKMQKPSGAEPSEYDAKDIAKVAELLEITPESILSKLEASYVRDDTFVALRTVSKDDTALEDALLTVKGIMITDTPVRYYPLGKKASHLVGYIQNISSEELGVLQSQGYHTNSVIGKIGLEKIYENELRGRDGSEIAITDSSGNLY